jgi:hypothetical protein
MGAHVGHSTEYLYTRKRPESKDLRIRFAANDAKADVRQDRSDARENYCREESGAFDIGCPGESAQKQNEWLKGLTASGKVVVVPRVHTVRNNIEGGRAMRTRIRK